MISTSGCTPPIDSWLSRIANTPVRARSESATMEIASCVAVPIVAIACATSVRSGSWRAASTAAALSARRFASTTATVVGSSPSMIVASWAGSAALRKSNDTEPCDITRPTIPTAFSRPNAVSSSPVASSWPPREGTEPPVAIRRNSPRARAVEARSTPPSCVSSAASISARSSPR